MKDEEFNIFAKRLNVEAEDGPYDSVKDLLKDRKIPDEMTTVQEMSDFLGIVIITLNNDLTNPLSSQLPLMLR